MTHFWNSRSLRWLRTHILTIGVAASFALMSLAQAASSNYSSSGNWTAPSGVTSITVEAWGGGGAGGGATTNLGKGGGGAGGQYARKLLTVVPGQTYAVVVGAAGTGSTGSGTAGGDSTFAATSVVAKGGAGGTNAANGVAGVGSTAGGVGDVVYAGGSGSSGSAASGTGGAGGGGAGSTGAGGNASGLTGGLGTANSGGDGADGLNSRGAGGSGNAFGGGGYMTNSTTRSGGGGGNGQVTISYAQAPTNVSTNAATSVTGGGATLNGSVTSNGGITTVTFEYGLTTSYGTTITAAESPAAFDASSLAVTGAVSGLAENTTYHFRVTAVNSAGTTYGSDRTFTTLRRPTVATTAASALSTTGATLNGTVSSNGTSTTVTFNYGLTTSYGSIATASASPLSANASNSAVSAAVTGLSCATTYHFQASGTNSAGTQTGSDLSFSTSACPVPVVTSINRVDFTPARAGYAVSWTVIFNTSVTGVDATDFALVQTGGASGASITGVSGSGTTYTVTASTGAAGTLGLNLVDNDSIVSGSTPLGGAGLVNGNFTGQTYTLLATVCTGAADILFCDDFERSSPGSVGNNWTVTPANASNCTGTTGNTGCAGIDSDIPPFNTYANPRPNSTRAMFTRWSIVSVDSPVVSLSGIAGAQLSFWIRRGRDTFSECPEASGENYLVQYYASNNTWKTLAQYPSSPTAAACDGKIFTPTIELPPDALHANFKMRFYQPSGSGDSGSGGASGVRGYDYWHMDDVVIRKVESPVYVGAFCDNFEAGLSRWSISAENYSSGNIGDASIGSLAYQSSSHELDMRWGYVTASTFKTNLTGVSGNITFWLKSGAGTLDPANNENLIVEYLNSSGAWITLNTYLGSVNAGTTYTASYALPTDAKHAGFRLRFRQVAGSGYDKSYWHIDDVCVGTAVATSDLALTKTGDTTLIPGTNTTYTLKATNNGPDALSGAIQIIDTLPSGLTYLSGAGTGWLCTANAQVVTCNWSGSLANGALAPDLIITASVGAGVTGSLTNTAVLTGTGNDLNTGNNTASFTSGNFIPYFIFTNSPCVDGIAIGQTGQTCSDAVWTSMVAGQSKTGIYITAVNASRVPTKLSSSASTTVSTQFGLTCHDPIANAGVQATFTATAAALPLCTGNGADPTSWSTATSLTFASGAPSVATSYTFTYADVGEVELFMRNSVATTQVGKSGHFVVKPAGFVLSAIKCTTYAAGTCATAAIASPGTNPGASTATGTAFIQAGQPFSVTVTAVNTSNVATPNFGKEQIPEGVQLDAALVLPSGGNAAALNNPTAFGNFVAGVATGTTFNWPEVGIITLTPSLASGAYLGTDGVIGTTSGNVGRFIPDHFAITAGAVAPACVNPSSGFTYFGQDGVTTPFTLTAQNLTNGPTQNYTDSFTKLPLTTWGAASASAASPGYGYSAATLPAGAVLSGSTTAPTGSWPSLLAAQANRGVAAIIAKHQVSRPTALTGITSLTISAKPVDSDGVTMATTAVASASDFYYGRLKLTNSYGSELLNLPMPLIAEYWNGSGWFQNTIDNCTAVTAPTSAAGLTFYPEVAVLVRGNHLSSTETTATVSSTGKLVAGDGKLIFSKPGALNDGYLTVTIPLATMPWLQFPWTGGANVDPSARATFGIFKSPLIYRRENY